MWHFLAGLTLKDSSASLFLFRGFVAYDISLGVYLQQTFGRIQEHKLIAPGIMNHHTPTNLDIEGWHHDFSPGFLNLNSRIVNTLDFEVNLKAPLLRMKDKLRITIRQSQSGLMLGPPNEFKPQPVTIKQQSRLETCNVKTHTINPLDQRFSHFLCQFLPGDEMTAYKRQPAF
jgi:hypothetical protein